MLHVALVGAGGMARLYRKVYATLPGVELTVAIDLHADQLQACRDLGAKRVSTEFGAALAADIDLVDISTPNHLHEEQAIAALNAGKHVLLQKPMANSLKAADHILAVAAKSTGKLGMYMSSYTNPLMWEIKRIVDGGFIGKVQSVRARDAHTGGMKAAPNAGNWRGDRNLTGGGSFVQLSIHAINLMQWWLGASITEVFAYSANQYSPNMGGDDVTVAVAKFGSGVYGTFDSGWASEGMTREIYGTQGSIRLIKYDEELEILLDRPFEGQGINYQTPGKVAAFPAPGHVLDDISNPLNQQRMFIEAIAAGKPAHMTGAAGRQDLAVVAAAYRSVETKRPEVVGR
ncbi:MAG: Gfo/Idh/MocA family oxidoreductase [Planctomycetota bacterium]|nr:Gfo/Idh/MocA family oxidoreductase [Planctomycetota bacterium]